MRIRVTRLGGVETDFEADVTRETPGHFEVPNPLNVREVLSIPKGRGATYEAVPEADAKDVVLDVLEERLSELDEKARYVTDDAVKARLDEVARLQQELSDI